MPSVNKVMLVGNIGKDPSSRMTKSGKHVSNFTLATSEKNSQGDEKTEWHNIVSWDKTAAYVSQYLKKGSKVYVEGRLQTRKFEDQNGQERYITEVVASRVMGLDKREQREKPPVSEDYAREYF